MQLEGGFYAKLSWRVSNIVKPGILLGFVGFER